MLKWRYLLKCNAASLETSGGGCTNVTQALGSTWLSKTVDAIDVDNQIETWAWVWAWVTLVQPAPAHTKISHLLPSLLLTYYFLVSYYPMAWFMFSEYRLQCWLVKYVVCVIGNSCSVFTVLCICGAVKANSFQGKYFFWIIFYKKSYQKAVYSVYMRDNPFFFWAVQEWMG